MRSAGAHGTISGTHADGRRIHGANRSAVTAVARCRLSLRSSGATGRRRIRARTTNVAADITDHRELCAHDDSARHGGDRRRVLKLSHCRSSGAPIEAASRTLAPSALPTTERARRIACAVTYSKQRQSVEDRFGVGGGELCRRREPPAASSGIATFADREGDDGGDGVDSQRRCQTTFTGGALQPPQRASYSGAGGAERCAAWRRSARSVSVPSTRQPLARATRGDANHETGNGSRRRCPESRQRRRRPWPNVSTMSVDGSG